MSNQQKISNILFLDKVDSHEIQSVLLGYYSRCRYLDDRTIVYARDETTSSVLVKFTKAGKIVDAWTGEDFVNSEGEDLSNLVKEHILYEHPTEISRRVMFSGQRLTGFYTYRDKFQIFPLPEDAPSPELFPGDYPFLVEFSHNSSKYHPIKYQRANKAAQEIELLCSIFLCPAVHPQPTNTTFSWTINFNETEPTCSYRQVGYHWPGSGAFEQQHFSAVDSFLPAPEKPINEYYSDNAIDVQSPLHIPDSLTNSLDAYFKLEPSDRDRFISACYWHQQAGTIRNSSQSAAYIALISAIEALTPTANGDKCDICNNNIGPGPTQLFFDFIEKYAPDSATTPARRKELYRIRSKITHGDKIMLADRREWIGSFLYIQEMNKVCYLSLIVRIALINWLLTSNTRS